MMYRSASYFVALVLLSLFAWAAHASEIDRPPRFEVADQYVAAYLSANIAALSPWMDAGIHFFDTASDFKGKEATIAGLSDVFKSIRMGDFSESHRQYDGARATYQGMLRFQMDGAAFGAPGKWYDFDVPFSVILRMNGDKVIEHQDMVDTNALNAQFRDQYFGATANYQ